MDCTFSKEERLLKRQDFLRLAASGRKLHTGNFIIVWSENEKGTTRLGITVSRKVGNAVTRNRIKRLIREYFRLNKSFFMAADFNLIGKRGAAGLSFDDIRGELDKALPRIAASKKC